MDCDCWIGFGSSESRFWAGIDINHEAAATRPHCHCGLHLPEQRDTLSKSRKVLIVRY